MITVATSVIRLNGCVTVLYRSISTYKQARSQEVRRGGSINTSESIYPGAQNTRAVGEGEGSPSGSPRV